MLDMVLINRTAI